MGFVSFFDLLGNHAKIETDAAEKADEPHAFAKEL
jgi:hypothetical protein